MKATVNFEKKIQLLLFEQYTNQEERHFSTKLLQREQFKKETHYHLLL
jgi:hypothetical protein